MRLEAKMNETFNERNTRMHSSRMRTGRSLTVWGGECLLPGGLLWGGLLPLLRGAGVYSGGVCLLWEVSTPGGVSALGGLLPLLPGGVCSQGSLLPLFPGGVCSGGSVPSAPGGWGVCSQGVSTRGYPSMH